MNIIEITRRLIEAMSGHDPNSSFDKWKGKLSDEINDTEDADSIQDALQIDKADQLPFEQKKAMYEKLISLRAEPDLIRQYAWWLELNGGPAWDEEVEYLFEQAEAFE